MLVLKNGNNVISEAGKPLVNAEVNALRIENTNGFQLTFSTTSPISISWGDGTFTNYGIVTNYSITKNYAATGNYDIVFTNAYNVTLLNINSTKINTSVLWLSQFVNLNKLILQNATFKGDLAPVLDGLKKLTFLNFNYYTTTPPISINVSNCKSFWSRCVNLYFYTSGGLNIVSGILDDVNIPLDATYISFTTYSNRITGGTSGIFKNGYTALTFLQCTSTYSFTDFPLTNLDNFIIPDTLKDLTIQFHRLGSISNFNFKNLSSFVIADCFYDPADFDNNQSFTQFGSTCKFFNVYNGRGIIKFNLAKINSPNYAGTFKLQLLETNSNRTYGDATYLMSKTAGPGGQFMCLRGLNDGAIYGMVSESYDVQIFTVEGVNINISAAALKYMLSSVTTVIYIKSITTITGDMSGAYFKNASSSWFMLLSDLPNLYADITTFTFGTWWNTVYTQVQFASNPHFTGDLSAMPLWANKGSLILAYCAYTGIPGFVRKVFTNRNTCLKAAGGMTNIQVQGNVDNNLLTGVEQQPPLGSYTGNINDLTEAHIDNLAAGKDYTGSGTTTPWTDKELIWVMTKLKNSSTDSSLRYRCTFNY